MAISPLFLLTIPHWIHGILLVGCALALIILFFDVKQNKSFTVFSRHDLWLWSFVITFSLPFAAIFLGQLFRQDFAWFYYDSPSRFLACLPILFVLVQKRLDVLRPLVYSIPLALFIALIAVVLRYNMNLGQSRLSTYGVDLLTFGSLSLMFGLCCLLSIDLYQRDSWKARAYKFLGFIVGIVLSTLSGSRTGWLAVPLVLILWTNIKMKGYRILALISVVCLCIAIYYLSNTLQHRLDAAIQELTAYNWNRTNTFNSVGGRLSFLRMADFLFMQNPLGGFGDQGFAAFINHPQLNTFATQEAQEFALRCGFHNEIATNMVRSGIWGLLSSVALFLTPAIFFIGKLRSYSPQVKKIAFLALGYLICTFISGMTTEVFNLKFTASFHALMFTFFISALLMHSEFDKEYKQNESK